MALRTNFNIEVFASSGAGFELAATAARYSDFWIIRVNVGSHAGVSFKSFSLKGVIIR
jgi:hypothetical protein